MNATVHEHTSTLIHPDGFETRAASYEAWCFDGHLWHGSVHIVGLESAPNYAAIRDAETHNDREHAA